MPFLGITTLLAVIAIVHVIQTGRSQMWIMALISLPGLGVLAYIIAEVLPELVSGRTGRKASKNIDSHYVLIAHWMRQSANMQYLRLLKMQLILQISMWIKVNLQRLLLCIVRP